MFNVGIVVNYTEQTIIFTYKFTLIQMIVILNRAFYYIVVIGVPHVIDKNLVNLIGKHNRYRLYYAL